MAEAKSEAKKGKNTNANHTYKLYDNSKLKSTFCPKCGLGVHMGAHKSRKSCGKCGYTEFSKA